jgi:general secretion pathway protein G
MGKSIVTGDKVTGDKKEQRGDAPTLRRGDRKPFPVSPISASRVSGFTLLELMIVISIIIILAAIALPQYQRTIMHARETVLRDDLFKMRSLIDQYAADKGKLPQSMDELVSSGYVREIPVDPFTNQKDWAITTGEDPNSTEGEQGMTDVHSSSSEISSDGTPYSEW